MAGICPYMASSLSYIAYSHSYIAGHFWKTPYMAGICQMSYIARNLKPSFNDCHEIEFLQNVKAGHLVPVKISRLPAVYNNKDHDNNHCHDHGPGHALAIIITIIPTIIIITFYTTTTIIMHIKSQRLK